MVQKSCYMLYMLNAKKVQKGCKKLFKMGRDAKKERSHKKEIWEIIEREKTIFVKRKSFIKEYK